MKYQFYINKNNDFMVDVNEIRSITYNSGNRYPWIITYKDGSKFDTTLDIAMPLIRYMRGQRRGQG